MIISTDSITHVFVISIVEEMPFIVILIPNLWLVDVVGSTWLVACAVVRDIRAIYLNKMTK